MFCVAFSDDFVARIAFFRDVENAAVDIDYDQWNFRKIFCIDWIKYKVDALVYLPSYGSTYYKRPGMYFHFDRDNNFLV